ncbi:hypothetical protein GBAR_LOCUS18891, partial [Geodia barretti]
RGSYLLSRRCGDIAVTRPSGSACAGLDVDIRLRYGPAEVSEADRERVVEELQGRSFRQFDPHLDASPRKAVI